MTSDHLALRERRANGIPVVPDTTHLHWAQRLVRSPWLWVTLGMTLVYLACLWWMYSNSVVDRPIEGGRIPGLNASAIRRSAQLALPTLAVWIVLFLALDRYRPMRPLLWWLALGWGGAVSTAASMLINTWASQEMAIVGDGDPTQGARVAVFVAPFVEEATKATILFLIAIALRYRMVTTIQAVALGGLSGAGFAFTENILYYSRVIVYSSVTIEAGDPERALADIVLLRGVKTAFGHPLFTVLATIGLIIALRSASKVVRIIAPVIGYLVAALAHMIFNFLASVGMDANYMALFGWIAVVSVAIRLILQVLAEGHHHRDRLDDYVLMGWLPPELPERFARQRTRWASAFIALSYGWHAFMATLRAQRTVTELVHLRDSMVRGLIDAAGHTRERELLQLLHDLLPIAITDPKTQRFQLPQPPEFLKRLGRRRRVYPADPAWGPPGSVPGNVPVTTGSAPVGSPQYSPVDPRWGPPKG